MSKNEVMEVAARDRMRATAIASVEKATQKAVRQRDGILWMLDNGLTRALIRNAIYYPFADKWGFGWDTPLTNSERDELLNVISEFPFAYEVKCADGKKLEGY